MRRKTEEPEDRGAPDRIIGVLTQETHVDGSKLYPCVECRRQVWMSPASQRLLATGKWLPSCERCGQAAIAAGADLQGPAPGALEEFQAWLKRN
jgi:hypothetical protein